MTRNRKSVRLSRYWKNFLKSDLSNSAKARIFGDSDMSRTLHLKNKRISISKITKEWKTRWLANQIFKDLYSLNQRSFKKLLKNLRQSRSLSKPTKGHFISNIILKQELRIDIIMYRLGWTNSIIDSQQLIKENKVLLHSKNNFNIQPHTHTTMNVGDCLELLIDLKFENKITHTLLETDYQNDWIKEMFNEQGRLVCFMIRKPDITQINLPQTLDISKLI